MLAGQGAGLRGAAVLCLVQLVVTLGAVTLVREAGGVVTLWPGTALTLAMVLRHRRLAWPALLAGAGAGVVAGATAGGAPLPYALVLTLVGLAESLLGAVLMRAQGLSRVDLARPRHLQCFALVVLVAPLVSAVPVALFRHLVLGAPLLGALADWAMAHAVGLAVLLPPLLAAFGDPNPLRRPWRETLVSGGVMAGVSLCVFLPAAPTPLLFLLFPPLLLLTWRHGHAGPAGGLAMVALLGLPLTIAGHGPLADQAGLVGEVRLLQFFLLVLSATTLPIAALLASRQRLHQAQRRGEAEIRRQALLLDSVLACMEQGLAAFDAGGRLLAANARYSELLGLPPAMLVRGLPYLHVARLLAARGELGPGDPEELAQQRLRSSNSGRHHRLSRTRPNGLGVEINSRPLAGGGWVATISDMTEQVQRERQLTDSEASFRLLCENSGDVVTRIGLDGRFNYVSPAALRVLGWMPEELAGQPMLGFIQAEDRAWAASSHAALAAGEAEEATVTFRFQRADESEAWVEAHARLLRDADDQPMEVVMALRDATDRKLSEAELLAAFEQMEAMAQTDGLTGLANRRRLDEMLSREWRRAMREGTSLAMLLLDADRFKLFNDRYGHAAGDDCLRQIAEALTSAARRPGDLAARYGGEEFAVLLPSTDLAGALVVAERLRQEVVAIGLEHLGNPPLGVVSVSIGAAAVSLHPDAAMDIDGLLRAADAALYAAKSGGRNRVAAGPEQVAA